MSRIGRELGLEGLKDELRPVEVRRVSIGRRRRPVRSRAMYGADIPRLPRTSSSRAESADDTERGRRRRRRRSGKSEEAETTRPVSAEEPARRNRKRRRSRRATSQPAEVESATRSPDAETSQGSPRDLKRPRRSTGVARVGGLAGGRRGFRHPWRASGGHKPLPGARVGAVSVAPRHLQVGGRPSTAEADPRRARDGLGREAAGTRRRRGSRRRSRRGGSGVREPPRPLGERIPEAGSDAGYALLSAERPTAAAGTLRSQAGQVAASSESQNQGTGQNRSSGEDS